MKILLINGSSRPNGCTYTALREIADTLESGGAETEILFLGSGPVRDCTACRTCWAMGALIPRSSNTGIAIRVVQGAPAETLIMSTRL